MPPAPMTAPRYRFRSGDAGVRIPLAVEQVAEGGGIPLVDPEERDQDQTHPHRLGPEERGDVGRDRRHAQQHEANVLPQPGAQRQHDLLARAVLGAEVVGDATTSQQADELHRSREQVRLTLHVVAVHARTEALQDGRLGTAREILREIQLAPFPTPMYRNALRTKSMAALWKVWASPAAATSRKAPGPQNPAWISR